jgi:hypothetical protein
MSKLSIALILIGTTFLFLITKRETLKIEEREISLPEIGINTKDLDQEEDLPHFRDLFLPPIGLFGDTPSPKREIPNKIQRPLSSLKLVGIIGGDSPIAILEEKDGEETYIVRGGDTIGKEEVLEIKASSVLIRIENHTLELFLWESIDKERDSCYY